MNKSDRKRKTRAGSKSQSTVPAFLLKTYEILEVPTLIRQFPIIPNRILYIMT